MSDNESTQSENPVNEKGKIRIIDELCQGCGNCVSACPNGGFKVINGKARVVEENFCDGLGFCISKCPFDAIEYNGECVDDVSCFSKDKPRVGNWPIKMHIVIPKHEMFKNANLAIVADCVAPVYKQFEEIAKNYVVLIACPKVENSKAIKDKLTTILNNNDIASVTTFSIDYVCCKPLSRIVKDSIRFSKKKDKLLPTYKKNVICLFGVQK